HRKAAEAIDGGRFKEEIVGVPVQIQEIDARGRVKTTDLTVDTDEGPRRDTTILALAGLKPVFKKDGTVTAGNSCQRSDGAVALGHPLVCTGSRQSATLFAELERRGGGIGMITMCIGGGMGAAGLFEV